MRFEGEMSGAERSADDHEHSDHGQGDHVMFYRPTWAEISLDALQHNIEVIRKAMPADKKVLAVVKADAYGHGAIEVSRHALRCGVDYLAVAFLDEALELRQAGIEAPILIMGYTPPSAVKLAIDHDVTLTVFSEDVLEALAELGSRKQGNSQQQGSSQQQGNSHQQGSRHQGDQQSSRHQGDQGRGNPANPAKIHIKIDTGMSRLGVRYDEAIPFIERALQLPGIEVEGLFTHYACADESDKTFTHEQHERMQHVVAHFADQNIQFPIVHAGNSATAIDVPHLSFNMVRLGISMYGLYPSAEVNTQQVRLQPVMTFKSQIVMIKKLPPHVGVSYGQTYHTQGEEQIATIPVGYADGYSRALSGDTSVLLRGQKAAVIGRICMDQLMINATGWPDLKQGEEIVLFGKQGDAVISAEELAHKLRTINYEITCKVSHRVPRVYYKDGQRYKVTNRLVKEFGYGMGND